MINVIICVLIKLSDMCYLVWSTHISPVFLSAVRLIDRVGKVPKDKLCIQDVGMPDQYIVKFFDLCEQFFDIIIKVDIILYKYI